MEHLIDLVDPFFAVDAPGNCLVGPYRPFGLARPGPDVEADRQTTTGYRPGAPVRRLSQTHVAGTGGAGRYGNLAIAPFVDGPKRHAMKPFLAVPPEQLWPGSKDEAAELGWYGVTLAGREVRCELTSTDRVALHRYTWPADRPAWFLLELGSAIVPRGVQPGLVKDTTGWDSGAHSIGGFVQVVSDHEIIGRTDLRGGWGHDKPYSFHFALRSDRAFAEVLLANGQGLLPGGVGALGAGADLQTAVRLDEAGGTAELQMGLSFVSVAQARAAIDREVGAKDFAAIRIESREAWRSVTDRFAVEGGTRGQRAVFASCLHRLHCLPTDLGTDDENPWWHSGVHQFTDWYCLWDSVRNANSWFGLFRPDLAVDHINALLDIAEHTDWLPDAHIAGHHAFQQSACAADLVLGEAAQKHLPGIDWNKALKWTRKNAEAESPDPMLMGRFRDRYESDGYLSTDLAYHCVSRHIEYAYHDWNIAQIARAAGDEATADRYVERSRRIWNLWSGARQAFVPRRPDGSFLGDYDPEHRNGMPYFYEGSGAIWSLNPLHDIKGLIERHGGAEAFIAHLDRMFELRLFAIKETRMHIPHLYTYAGRPDLAATRVAETLATYTTSPQGLTDNEDMGCQAGYYLFNSMGLYPIYGQAHYCLVPPLFDRVEADLGEGRELKITADRSDGSRCIVAATLDGQPLDRAWVTHAEIGRGAHLHLVLSDAPTDWGTTVLPPNGL